MHKKASALLFGGLVISRGCQKLVLVTKRALNRPCGTQTRGILGFSTHGRARDLPSLLSLFSTLILEFGLKATRTKDERQCACFFLCFFFSSFFFSFFYFLFFHTNVEWNQQASKRLAIFWTECARAYTHSDLFPDSRSTRYFYK